MATILVTGASDGLGRALAEDLAAAGHRLLLHGRDTGRLAQVAADTGGEVYRADLSSLAGAKRLAAEVAARHDRLDVLVNNAAVGFRIDGAERTTSADGHELRLAVNYLAPVLLTRELLPLLRRSAPSRVVNIASRGQQELDLEDPQFERGFTEPAAYRRSKLALISHTLDLAGELVGSGVTVNSLHPGTYMETSLTRAAGVEFHDPLEKGVAATRRLVDAPELERVSGRHFDDGVETPPSVPAALDPGYRRRLAELTNELLEKSGV
ncbi:MULTISPECIES: SDR family NAD(P)-dependent oxidoreductase [Nocardiopsis]|uniref:Short-chain dehydrogenase/reductase SDR n=1 Tax=Nocardiopsis dassonvillei (strain ATCC 23218 / DSM 43111 / CIP 107115 / JCM 7437 / KCTC 9190 / NBRC 14626 / NCTC 10488 / NRRL B-5397 / IMRU 509) TaxID=446468 RepID=D7B666_NOCDD|nr:MULTISPECIES: SDR family NAD(P)-dependent oxidoreductase [Nocardiopsis]ADH67331.1 short-chain dehydrogenase/reductase SDR [Nocardiopsis dassonvillei subsp. dassonvillei DSM 43111]APC35545.1 short-chain dehydrogenase [Nocardiopsis dassonvillei]NKY77334.1 SDR family NAD(P)-dependent oxidoreductase [Nocardiopsis dassonvillei]VEI87461.1 Rhamnolipids biosynthesis 3-oxoacyl-[acyl-carrier-protein] reductase [Nocardiopsis dassonvillei]